MKKIILVVITVISFITLTTKLNALDGYTNTPDVIIRTEAYVDSSTYLTILRSSHVKLNLIDSTLYNVGDPNCPIGWYKINYEGNNRYICGEYVNIGNLEDKEPTYNETTYDARIYGSNIYVKTGASSYTSTQDTLAPGTNVVILGDKVSGPGCNDGWYRIQYHKDKTGYTCSRYIRKKEELVSTNAEYEEYLKKQGFPESYIPYLVKLHELHPNWTFNAVHTGYNWDYVIYREASYNVISKTYLNSAVFDVYQKGQYIENGWYLTTDAVNAFYLDPRNFLTEKFIFMFEALDYNYDNPKPEKLNKESEITKQYYNTIKGLFNGSYLNTDEYIYMFIEAGFKYNVNPIHLAARSVQEGASSATYEAITGESTSFYGIYPVKGYYNYYNIHAVVDDICDRPVITGLAYACGEACGYGTSYLRPWNTREKAIFGGAYFIADGYINRGQHTLYFQKFDVSPTSPTEFTHQYQTNITAPCSEAANAFSEYEEQNFLNLPFTFDIPIYDNMPSVTSLPLVASTVNTLKEIKVDGKVLTGYDEDVVDYTVYINNTKNTVNIEVTKKDNASTVTGIGEITLTGDETLHEITVTAESGLKKIYRIKLVKVEDSTSVNDILSNLSVKVTGNIMNHISPETLISTLEQSIYKYSPRATVTVFSNKGEALSGTTLLSTGQTIKILAPNGETKTFNIVVTGDTNGDGRVNIQDLLKVQKHLLKSTLLTDLALKGADTNGDGNVNIQDLLRVQKYILGNKDLF